MNDHELRDPKIPQSLRNVDSVEAQIKRWLREDITLRRPCTTIYILAAVFNSQTHCAVGGVSARRSDSNDWTQQMTTNPFSSLPSSACRADNHHEIGRASC